MPSEAGKQNEMPSETCKLPEMPSEAGKQSEMPSETCK